MSYSTVIGGTSTGGISAIALSYQDDKGQVMSAKDVINLYLKCGRDIFRETATVGVAGSIHNAAASAVKLLGSTTGTKYAPDGLESIAAKMVGTNKFARERFKIPVLVTAVDNTRQQLKIFCTVDDEDKQVETVKIVRATSAAQSFFPAIQIGEVVYIDGGHLANQPAKEFRDYYVDVLAKKLGMPKDLNVFSFGTGDASQIKQPEELHAQWLVGKIESTIQLLFAKQEKDANRAIINEVKLTRMKSLIAERDAELKEHEVERSSYRRAIDKLERQLIDDSLRLSVGMDDLNVEHMRENSQELKDNIAELRRLEREAEVPKTLY